MTVEPVILEGPYVRLEPLSLSHLPGFVEVGLDPDLWRWTTTCLASAEDVRRYIETALH
jgi:hypothetical protein